MNSNSQLFIEPQHFPGLAMPWYQMTLKSTTSFYKDFVHLSCILHHTLDSQHLLIYLTLQLRGVNIIIAASATATSIFPLGAKPLSPWHPNDTRTAQGVGESQCSDLSFLSLPTSFENISLRDLGKEWESQADNDGPTVGQTTGSITPQPHLFFCRCFQFPSSSARCF